MKKFFLLSVTVMYTYILQAQETRLLSTGKPGAIADLKTTEGAALVNAEWYVQKAEIQTIDFKLPGASASDMLLLYPTGAPVKTNTIHPQIGSSDFDKDFIVIEPAALESRQGNGLASFVWYKAELTIPKTIGNLSAAGTTAIFEIVVDDYSEIWVNGKQMQAFGESGNGLIAGYNARNRVVLTNNAIPGEKFSIAILGINGPLGKTPDNYIWIRTAVVDFIKQYLSMIPGRTSVKFIQLIKL
jgi:gluconolactonase